MQNRFRIGELVRYQGRAYRILGVTQHGIAGPHYRLGACGGDYPNEDSTSQLLLSRLDELPETLICPNCDGTGTVALDDSDEGKPCPVCGGTGTLVPRD